MNETGKCLALIAFGAILGWGATTIWPLATFEPTKKDWVDLLAAAGTCAAVIVAMWFGTRERILARREAYARATLVAAKITPRLARLMDQTLSLTARFVFQNVETQPAEVLYAGIRTVADVMHWEIATEDLAALAPLPRHAAVRLSRGIAISNTVASAIIDAQKWFTNQSEWDMRTTVRDAWVSQLHDAWALFNNAFNVCNEAAKHATLIDAAMLGLVDSEK